ncbi:hypothetical protein T01_12243 [Trichinella spiralis]|uniref:Uncharacterized protein n=1 Tax=Trichinella spiralis TaxID=6334 RepID=A0A0V0Z3D9_TRISP|nr:hypothetical protein T01_12243 [Trichinella spiralis]
MRGIYMNSSTYPMISSLFRNRGCLEKIDKIKGFGI